MDNDERDTSLKRGKKISLGNLKWNEARGPIHFRNYSTRTMRYFIGWECR